MKLTLKNIGKFNNAEIDLNGITVIAGENNTGKSTISKALYCVFNSFSHNGEQIKREKRNKVVNLFRNFIRENDNLIINTAPLGNKIYELIENGNFTPQHLMSALEETQGLNIAPEQKDILLNNLQEICSITDKTIQTTILKRFLFSEFVNQIKNIFNDELSEIQLKIKDKTVDIKIYSENDIDFTGNFDLITEALYLDDPCILDNLYPIFQTYSINEHREHLKKKFIYPRNNDVLDEILANKKLDNILALINSACDGKLTRSERSMFEYSLPATDKTINIRNVSMGLKSFAILKSLLLNGNIQERATLILDEPEVHLHPKWQLVFAEIIVLLQKEFNLTILLNTHSPYFMEAIEVYSKKHQIEDKCKYYLTEDKDKASITDATENVESIYKKLAEPYQTLSDVRFGNDD